MSHHLQKNKLVRFVTRCAMLSLLGIFSAPAFAHIGAHDAMSFQAGFAHPFSGLDHLLAMTAVGLWAAQAKSKARWLLPLTFLLTMVVGAVPGMLGIVFPGIEIGIATSVAVLGVLIACAVSLPVWLSHSLVAMFAMVHGYAHGAELPYQASGGFYAMGFIAATALLHLLGFSASVLPHGKITSGVLRLLGSLIAVSGAFLLLNTVQ